MSKTLKEATSRLSKALRSFEDAVAHRLNKEQSAEDLEQHIQSLSAEQERLLASLKLARRRADRLESANDEVSNRLETVIDSIKTIVRIG